MKGTALTARRAYILSHPLALFFSVGIMLPGILLLIGYSPDRNLEASGLPNGVQTAWHLSYTLGGAGLLYGILANNPRIEGAGAMLLAGPLAAIAYLSLHQDLLPFNERLPGVLFLACLALGCLARFACLYYFLARPTDGGPPRALRH